MSFMDKVLGIMGFAESDEYEEVYEEEKEVQEQEPRKRKAQLVAIQGHKDVSSNADLGNTKVVLQEPVEFEHAQGVADNLKNKKAVIINLEKCDLEVGKRIIDFVGGTIYAIGGTMQKVGNGIILAAPPNIDIASELRDKYFEDQAEVFSWVTKYNRKGDF